MTKSDHDRHSTIVQLRHRGVLVPERDSLSQARDRFDRGHWILLPKLLAPELVTPVLTAFEQTAFADYEHEGIGSELCARHGLATGVLELLANDPEFLEIVRVLTGCGPIGSFVGRVYRMVPGQGHYDSWHSDVGGDRMIAMSINLSARPYSGGLLQMRQADGDEIFCEVANLGLGDALLFRIDPSLRHRVTDVVGSVAKTAYAGWFRSRPAYRDLVRERDERLRRDHPIDDGVHHA
jgi:hypothetical protein